MEDYFYYMENGRPRRDVVQLNRNMGDAARIRRANGQTAGCTCPAQCSAAFEWHHVNCKCKAHA